MTLAFFVASLPSAAGWPPTRARAKAIGLVMRRSLGRAYEAGFRLAFDTVCGVSPHGLNGHEIELMFAASMSPKAALKSTTVSAAQLCGLWSRRSGPSHRTASPT